MCNTLWVLLPTRTLCFNVRTVYLVILKKSTFFKPIRILFLLDQTTPDLPLSFLRPL